MKPTIRTARAVRWFRTSLGCCLLLVVTLSLAHSQPPPQPAPPQPAPAEARIQPPPPPPVPKIKLPVEPGAVEVAFTDGSNLKMVLRDEKITLVTPHGKLLIAAADIHRIEFATRLSEEDARRIASAIADLASNEFRKREAAGIELLKLRAKAHPALLRAAEQRDPEVVRRAKELIRQIAASVPPDQLVVRKDDVVWTADSMIAGRIEGAVLKAHTSQFGTVQVKLSDARGLRSQAIEPVLPAPSRASSSMTMPSPTYGGLPAPR